MELKLKSVSRSLEDTKGVAYWLVDKLVSKPRCVVFLKGDLGVGKTTFVRYALEKMGINKDEFNGSPSFTLVNEYRDFIYHIDLYRLRSVKDVEIFGVYEYLENNGIFFIEWPELCRYEPDIVVEFRQINKYEREICVYKS